jgi:hypothetical protein
MTRNYWLDSEAADEREQRLPKWAQERLSVLRRETDRLRVGLVERTELDANDTRLAIRLGSDGHGGTLYRPLPADASIFARVTGGEMTVELRAFRPRTRLGIIGHGTWHAGTERNGIAVLPALGNVVEVAFVAPAVEVLPAVMLEINQVRHAIEPRT